MKVYKSVKKVPVTKLFSNIVTAYASSSQSFEERTPFIVYLPDGKEGVAVGSVRNLIDLMEAQSEGRIDKWSLFEQEDRPSHLATTCDFADIEVTLVIEPVAAYVTDDINRKEEQDAEEADYENDTL